MNQKEVMQEKMIEARLRRGVQKLGGMSLKWVSPGTAGVPDQLIWIKGMVIPVEVKNGPAPCTALQDRMHIKLKEQGHEVFIVRSYHDVDLMLDLIAEAIKAKEATG